MKIFRITETCNDIQSRETYKLLEKLNTFTLLECRNVSALRKKDPTSTLVLDHFDESPDPSSLLNQIFHLNADLSSVVLVDRNQHFSIPIIDQLEVRAHVIFHPEHAEGQSNQTNEQKHELLLEMLQNADEMAA